MTNKLRTDIAEYRRDLARYCSDVLKIRTKQALIQPFVFNEAQRLLHSEVAKQREEQGKVRCIVLKARQEGVSTYTAARIFRRIHLWPNTTALVIADSLERAGVLYDIYERFYELLPAHLKPERKQFTRRHRMTFEHSSELVVRPATDTEAGRAMTVHLLHASELAFWGSSNVSAYDTWTSLMQAVPHEGSEVIVESTAKGAGGFFHELWEQASEAPGRPWVPVFLPWWIHDEYELREVPPLLREVILDNPDDFEKQAMTEGIAFRGQSHVLSIEKLAWRRQVIVERFGGDIERLGKDATRGFMQEFPATAEEAFLVSGSCFFDEDVLRLWAREAYEAERRWRGRFEQDSGVVNFIPSDRGFVRIYEPPSKEGHYVIGADTSEGKLIASRVSMDTVTSERGGRDYSAAVVYDPVRKKVVAEVHGRIHPEEFARQLSFLGRFYSCGNSPALIGVERSHSSGQTVLRHLREGLRYPRLFWHREFNKRTKRVTKTLGWITNSETRRPMLDELAQLVRSQKLEVPSKDIIREMMTFVLHDDGKPAAEEGCHDDRVIALAIAVQMGREHKHHEGELLPMYSYWDEQTGM